MRALTRKLRRDAWHYRSQVAAIALVMASGVALFVALRSMHGYLRDRQAAYYAEYHFADLFATVKRAPAAIAGRLRAIPGVQSVETRVVTPAVLDVPGLAEPATGWLVSIPDRPRPMLNGLVLRSGRYPAPGRADEVLVSQAFARANALRPGDTLGAILRGRWETLRVVGTAISPEFIYEIPPSGATLFPDNRRFGVLWMGERGLAAAFDMTGAFNDALFTLAPGTRPGDVVARVDRLLARYGGLGAYERKDQTSDQFVSSEIEETEVTSVLLPSVFLGVTAFLLHLVLSRLVATEREQIAVLKAFGYGNWAVARHYLGFALVPVGLGTVVGSGIGVWLASGLAGIYARFYQFPDVAFRPDPGVILMAVAVSGGAAVIGALGAVRRVLALPPAEAMRPESPASYRAGWFERAGFEGRLPLAARTILRSIQRRPARALLATTGLALAVALTVSGRFMFDAIDFLRRLEFFGVWRHDVAVGFERQMPVSVRWELARLPGVTRVELLRDVPVRLRHGSASERTAIEGYEEHGELRRILQPDGAVLPPPVGGLVLGTALAKRLHVVPGDLVDVEVLEGRRQVMALPVAGVADQLLGLPAYLRFDVLQRWLREEPVATGALLAVDPGARAALNERLKRLPGVSGVTWLDVLRTGFDQTIAESFRISIVSIVLFAVIIACGVVYNAARVALAERGRELASLRVLGFTRHEVAAMLLGEQALLTLAAIPLGLAAGHVLCWLVVTRFTSDLFRLPLIISDRTRVFAVTVVLVAAAGSAYVVWRRIRALDLVAVLKTRERSAMTTSTRWRIVVAVVALALLLVWRLRPAALPVETVMVAVGPLRETIDADGETRVLDRYIVAAPVSGRLVRPLLRAGDPVGRGELVAWLEPAPLDARSRREAIARAEAADDARRAADAAVLAARAAFDQAARDRNRADSLAASGNLSSAAREAAELLETTSRRELDAAASRAETAAHDLETARAALFAAGDQTGPFRGRTPVRAPIAGRVLRLLEESERVVPAGTPLLEVGDPARLEVVSDLLSTDAVKVRPGDTVLVTEWGGDRTLRARVRLVEPSGFTKVSALGVEEQRVNVVADFVDPPAPLGDRYRVEVGVVLWGEAAVRQAPLSALVRRGAEWSVFVVGGGRVRARPVTLGHRGAFAAEVAQGLEPGEEIVAYPSDLVRDGIRVRATPRAGADPPSADSPAGL